jgi:hypothetical protein
VVGPLQEVHLVEDLLGQPPPLGRIPDLVEQGVVVEQLAGGEVLVGPEVLGEVAHQGLDGVAVGADVPAGDGGLAPALLEDVADDAHEGGFAGAVGPEQAEHPLLDVQVDPLEGGDDLPALADDRDEGDEAEEEEPQAGQEPAPLGVGLPPAAAQALAGAEDGRGQDEDAGIGEGEGVVEVAQDVRPHHGQRGHGQPEGQVEPAGLGAHYSPGH